MMDTKFKGVKWIETIEDCIEVTHELSSENEIAVDIEGVNQNNIGRISIIQIANKSGQIFIFDIIRLGTRAFGKGGLGFLMYSHKVLKVLFDSRVKLTALFREQNIKMRNIFDLQMFHFLKFRRKTSYHKGLGRCLEEATPLMNIQSSQFESIQKIRNKGLRLLSSGGEDLGEIWCKRPLDEYLIVYAAANVMVMLPMKDAWEKDSSSALIEKVTQITEDRINLAICGDKVLRPTPRRV